MNREGFIRGDATRNAISGGAGIPLLRNDPTRGTAANVHIGETTPITVQRRIDNRRRLRNSATRRLGRNLTNAAETRAPATRKTQRFLKITQQAERTLPVYVPSK
jgi:hypothetical protein